MSDYVKTYYNVWRDIVTDENGNLNFDQVMRELHDYSNLMEEASKVYYEVSGGMFSKPNTAARHVISKVEEDLNNQERDTAETCANFLEQIGEYDAARALREYMGVE